MKISADWLIKSRRRMAVTSFLISAAVSMPIYVWINFNTFYRAKGDGYAIESRQLFNTIQVLCDSVATSGGRGGEARDAIIRVIAKTEQSVTVTLGEETFDNGKKAHQDMDRSIVMFSYQSATRLGPLAVSTLKSNQPRLLKHLWLAWTWSLPDLLKDSSGYMKFELWRRSLYLYIEVVITWACAFLMFMVLRSKQEQNAFLNSQLEKEGYFMRKEYDTLLDEIEQLLQGGMSSESEIVADKRQKLQDIEAELSNIHARTNKNILNAKMEYFEPHRPYTVDEIREKLRISTITKNSDINVISYSDRYFQRESHVRFFIELLGLKKLNPTNLKTINVSVPVLRGQDSRQKEDEIRGKFAKYLPAALFEKLKIDVHNIHDKEYLHMRVMDIIGGNDKLTLTLDKGMDSLEPHKCDKEKYSTATRTYAVVAYGS